MKKAFVECAAGIGIAVSIFLAGFFVATMINKPFTHSGDMATWAGAFGTFLAFAGTIWIATYETRQRHQEALWRARIAAPSMLMKLTYLRSPVAQAIKLLENGTADRDLMAFCGGQIKGAKIWTVAEIEPFLSLPRQFAIDLALAKEVVESEAEFLVHPTEDISTLLPNGVIQLRSALLRIDAAIKELETVYDGPDFKV